MTQEESTASAAFFNGGKGIIEIKAGLNIIIDNRNPSVPVISAPGGGGGGGGGEGGGNVDLTNYFTKSETNDLLAGKANLNHTHTIANVTGLQTALDAKAPTVHTHSISSITNLQTTLNNKAASVHTHEIADVNGLQEALDAAGSSGGGEGTDLSNYYNKSEVDTIANSKASTSHTHTIANVTGLQDILDSLAAGGGGEGGTVALDVPGGALSFNRATKIEESLNSFLLEDLPSSEDETIVYDQTTTIINGITALENRGLQTNGAIFEYNGDVRLYTFLNVPTTFEGMKMQTFRFVGRKYTETSHCNLIGIKAGVLTPLIFGNGSPSGIVDITIDVSTYDQLHISGDIEFAGEEIDFYITSRDTNSEAMEQLDIVKNYIDMKTAGGDASKLNTILYSFLNDNSNPSVNKFIFETATEINGIPVETGAILKPNNTVTLWQEPGLVLHTFRNISTTFDGVKQNVLHFKGQEIGGLNNHTNLIGILNNNAIVDILPATKDGDFTPEIYDVFIDISNYKEVSLHFIRDADTPQGEEQFVEFLVSESTGIKLAKDSVKKYIDNKLSNLDIEKETYLHIDKPTTMPKIYIEGQVPTDASDARTPTNIILTYNYNNRNVFKCKSTMAIQGNWTVFENKKGYEFAFTNADDDDLKVQIGDWIPCNEFHFKAYPNDSSFSRDVTAMKIWHQIRTSREWPESYIADFKGPQGPDNAREDLLGQALFYTDGFPVECYLNGTFRGIYVFRLKKERDNYMLDNTNPNHIFLDNQDVIDWTTFDHVDWKVRSPKLTGYEEQGPITDQPLLDKLNRWWNWFKALEEETVVYADTKDQYINEGSWVDAFIAQQVTGHWDYQVNNMLLTSWDGQKLSICFYDADQTWGWTNAGSSTGQGIWYRSGWWVNTLYPNLLPAIRERYTWLRKNGVLTMNNIHRTFKLSTDMISRDVYLKEYANWPPTQGGSGKHTLRSSLNWAQNRLAQLDAVWLIP